MQTRRWVDPSQPQTLQIAVYLLYFQAFFALLYGDILSLAGGVAAGYGIANERKWGYGLGILVAVFPFIWRATYGLNEIFATNIITLMFEVALIVLLLHPQSREYQRIWFK